MVLVSCGLAAVRDAMLHTLIELLLLGKGKLGRIPQPRLHFAGMNLCVAAAHISSCRKTACA